MWAPSSHCCWSREGNLLPPEKYKQKISNLIPE
jgi:hypothetical protein